LKEKVLYIGVLAGTALSVAGVLVGTLAAGVSANTVADYSSLTGAVQSEFTGSLPIVLPVVGVLLAIGIVITFVMTRSKRAGR
jgi:hypothetical protein